MADRTFWDPKLPHSHTPILGKNLEFRTLSPFRYHNQRKTCQISNQMNCRFQSFWDYVIFVPRKGSKPEKGPNRSHIEFSCFPGGDTPKSWHRPNFKRNRFKFLHLELTELSVPKLPHLPNPIFGGKLEIRTMVVRRYQAGSRACQISNPTNTRSHCYRAPYFWSQKWGNAQNPLCHVHIPNFIGRFCTCGGSNQVLKIWAKLTWPIWCESVSKFGTQNFKRAQKRDLEPKKRLVAW